MARARRTDRLVPHDLDLVFSTFIEVTGLITTGASMSRIVSPILACACEIVSGKAAFAILEHKGIMTRISYDSRSRRRRPLITEEEVRLSAPAERIYHRRKVTVMPELTSAKQFKLLTGLEARPSARSIVTAGLRYRRARIGMIGVVITKGSSPDAQDLGVFGLLAREAGVAIKTAREFERTQTLSITDGLTGAYNYRFLIDCVKKEIGRATRFGERFSLIMLDVDGLKDYNDIHGHLRGSGVIKRVAALAADKLRSIDMLCKYGGDEFVVVLPRTAKAGAANAAERIRQSIDEYSFPGERLSHKITASMGIASFPEDGNTVHDLIASADSALYEAKRHGRNTVWLSGRKRPYSPD